MGSALSFYDGYRSEKHPGNLLQANAISSVPNFSAAIKQVSDLF